MTKSDLAILLQEYACLPGYDHLPLCGQGLQEVVRLRYGAQSSLLGAWSALSQRSEADIRQSVEEALARMSKVRGCIEAIMEIN